MSNSGNIRKKGLLQVNLTKLFFVTLLTLFTLLAIDHSNIHAVQSELSKVYHIYVDKEYTGSVSSQTVVEEVVQQKLDEMQDIGQNPYINEDITYVTERTFHPNYNDERVKASLNNLLTVKVEAYGLKIDDELIGHFKDEHVINNLLQKYKETFVKKKDLERLNQKENAFIHMDETIYVENREQFLDERDPIEVGGYQLVGVTLDHDVDVLKTDVYPEKILSLEEGLKLLNNGTVEEEKHTVQEGEVLQTIAEKYDLTVKELLALNPELDEDTVLQINQKLNVTEYKPAFDVTTIEETLVEEKVAYETEVIESDEMLKGEQEIKQEGENGEKEVLYRVEKVNGKEINREIIEEEITKEAKKEIIIKGTKVIPSQGSGTLTWPTNGGYISSSYGYRWGRMHRGIDIARPSNRTIKAADHGVVSFAGYEGGFGNKIVINHNNGMQTIYAHLSSINVTPGQKIEKGTPIGIMGTTGNSTGIHLHFEVHQGGATQNPMKYY